jgi:hypothetical protein
MPAVKLGHDIVACAQTGNDNLTDYTSCGDTVF